MMRFRWTKREVLQRWINGPSHDEAMVQEEHYEILMDEEGPGIETLMNQAESNKTSMDQVTYYEV